MSLVTPVQWKMPCCLCLVPIARCVTNQTTQTVRSKASAIVWRISMLSAERVSSLTRQADALFITLAVVCWPSEGLARPRRYVCRRSDPLN